MLWPSVKLAVRGSLMQPLGLFYGYEKACHSRHFASLCGNFPGVGTVTGGVCWRR